MTHSVIITSTLLLASLLTTGAAFHSSEVAQAGTLPGWTSAAVTEQTPKSAAKLLWQTNNDGQGMYAEGQQTSRGLVFYTSGGTLRAADIATGQLKWSYKNGTYPQIITKNSVFFITSEGELVKVSADTGKVLWKVKAAKAPIEVGAQARLISGVVYFANESGGIAAYNPVTGAKMWENPTIPMYAGSLNGIYNGTLLVSSTVDNIRSQFFGLDSATGKQRWRTEGLYSFAAYRDGRILLRESNVVAVKVPTPKSAPGYLMTLVYMDVATGKITSRENYQPLKDVVKLYNNHMMIQGSSVYSLDGNVDQSELYLTRFTLGKPTDTATTSYASYGNWLAGPTDGRVFFQKAQQIQSVTIADNTVVTFTHPASPVIHLQKIGKAVYAGFENGDFSILHADTGALLGTLKLHAQLYGRISVVNGTVLIPTDQKLFAVSLPQELR
ncbi:PQQ-like beta-propeller repeat protein [Paenibacillus albidus]|uniref:outer membrane protein assembly factor BamB family protein n=1 Tax=Paenibacillus albidus TaxID=2041023 RepID=UPI001BE7E0C0|nr:PQQ-binding-like beta-propeller repeat protein [Paenibacillus albidus]MBT2287866.1 PQQ-like beta-propeller repeat protein [Paenibacillus albidus]